MSGSVVEIRSFVPARECTLSLRFHTDRGFTLASDTEGVACFDHGSAAFLLRRFHDEYHAANFVMHLLVEDVGARRQRLNVATCSSGCLWGLERIAVFSAKYRF